MKKYLTLKNVMVWCAAVFVLVAFFISFAAKLTMTDHGVALSYNNVIWGCNSMTMSGTTVDLGANKYNATALSVVALILMLIAAIASVVVPFVVKNAKVTKIVALACGGVMVVTGVLMFFTVNGFAGVVAKASDTDVKDVLESIREAKGACAVAIVEGIFAILAGGAVIGSEFVPEKQLVK